MVTVPRFVFGRTTQLSYPVRCGVGRTETDHSLAASLCLTTQDQTVTTGYKVLPHF